MVYSPTLKHMGISLDLLDWDFYHPHDNTVYFDGGRATAITRLDFHCFDPAVCFFLKPSAFCCLIDYVAFQKLRIIGFHEKLGWGKTPDDRHDLGYLDDILKAMAREDGEGAEVSEADAGVVRIKTR